MTRVFVFGLDAASPALIQRWLGDLPNLRRLTEEGTWGPLKSTIPPFTSPAWTCMATGKNPAKVGIFGLRHREPDSYHFSSPTSNFRHAPAVWDIAGQAGKIVIVVNVPDTYPPNPVNGAMVSGRPAPVDAGAAITYPPGLRTRLNPAVGGYQVGPAAAFDDASQPDELETWLEVLKCQQTALEHLMDTFDWDLIFYVSMAIDGISHHFWKHLDSAHPDHDSAAAEKFGDVIRQIYIREDERIGSILERLTLDDLLLVVSDHGSVPCYRHIAVNRWLIENGYLVLKDARNIRRNWFLGPLSQTIFSIYRRSEWVRRLARPLRQTFLRDQLVAAHFEQHTKGRKSFDALHIDWEHTTAYYMGDDRVYLNMAEREPNGMVSPADYDQVRNKLKTALTAARDSESGKPLFGEVYKRDEIYTGPYMDAAPDLVLVPGDVHWNLGGAVGEVVVDRPIVSGKHHPDGVFLAWGAGVQPGGHSANIYDIAPTVLHVLGLPIPADTDGQVQLDWFAKTALARSCPVESVNYGEVNFSAYTLTKGEQEQVEARLRELGYLD